MNWIDALFIAVILLAVYSGWRRGFIIGALELGIMIGGLGAAFALYPYFTAFLEKYVPSLGVWTMPLSFILILILSRMVLATVVTRLLKNVPDETHQHTANRFLGMAPGLVNGFLYAAIVSVLLLALPLFNDLSAETRESRLANYLIKPVGWAEEKLAPVFDEAIKKSMNKLTVEPDSKKTVKLPYTVNNPKLREDLEARMLDLVNEERRKQGLKPVKADPEMAEVARAHSRDMFARGYFSHVNLDGKDPFDRIRAAKVRFITAGENLALAQTLSIAHRGLMNSPGHRANILHPSFGRLGIGILDGGIYGLMVTQNFRN